MADVTIKLSCPWCGKEIAVPDEDYLSGRFECPECVTVIEMVPDKPTVESGWTPRVIEGGRAKRRR